MDRKNVIKGLAGISDYFFDIYRNEKNGYSQAQEYCNVAEDAIALIDTQYKLILELQNLISIGTKMMNGDEA